MILFFIYENIPILKQIENKKKDEHIVLFNVDLTRNAGN